MTEFAPHAAYLHSRGHTDLKYNALAFTCLNAVTTRSETTTPTSAGIASPSIRHDYRDLDGKPTGFRRWRFVGLNAPHKCHQLKGTGNHPYFALPGVRSKKRWRAVAKNTRERIVICEGESGAAAGAARGLMVIGISGVRSWHGKKGATLPEWDWIEWNERPVDLAPDADIIYNPNVRRGWLAFADFLVSRGAVVRIRLLPLTENGHDGLDDFLALHSVADYEMLTAHELGSTLFAKWREEIGDGAKLPEFDLSPLDPAWLTKKLPPIEFTVAGIIPRRTVALLVSEGGVGKTHLALEIASSVASSDAFFDLPTHRGGVVYFALEDPSDILRRRVHNAHVRRLAELHRSLGEHRDRAGRLAENLHLVPLAGQQFHLVWSDRGLALQTSALDELIEKLRDTPIELVVLDPMARLHGADENANAVGTATINAAEKIVAEIGCTVLICHHTGKSAATRDDAYAARGASGIADAARVVLRLRALTDTETDRLRNVTAEEIARGLLKLIHAKCNYAPRFEDIWLKRTDTGGLIAFRPAFKDADDDYTAMLNRLRSWLATKPEGTMITQRMVRDAHHAIFDAGRNAAVRFFQEAVARGDLVTTGEVGRGGGALYSLALVKKATGDDD